MLTAPLTLFKANPQQIFRMHMAPELLNIEAAKEETQELPPKQLEIKSKSEIENNLFLTAPDDDPQTGLTEVL